MKIQQEIAEKNNPDSRYWRNLAELALEGVAALLGVDDYALWSELTFPGETIEGLTWKQIYEATTFGDPAQDIECDCNGVTGPCAVCQAYSRLHDSTLEG